MRECAKGTTDGRPQITQHFSHFNKPQKALGRNATRRRRRFPIPLWGVATWALFARIKYLIFSVAHVVVVVELVSRLRSKVIAESLKNFEIGSDVYTIEI